MTPEELQEYRSKYGINQTSQTDIANTNSKIDIGSLREKYGVTPQVDTTFDSTTTPTNQSKGFFGNVLDKLSGRLSNLGKDMTADNNGPVGAVSNAVNAVGDVAGGITDIIGEAGKSLFNIETNALSNHVSGTPSVVEKTINDAANNLLGSKVGQQAVSAIKQGVDSYKTWADANPSLARNLESVVNIAQVIPILKGASLAKDAAITGLENVGLKSTLEETALKDSINSIKAESKYMTPTGKKSIVTNGNVSKQGLFKSAEPLATPKDIELGTKFQKELSTGNFQEKINKINSYISLRGEEMTKFLKSNNAIYNPNELKATLKEALNAVYPEGVKDTTKQDVINVIMSKIKEGNLYGTWKGRSAFDASIDKLFDTTQVAQAGEFKLAARNALNDFINKKLSKIPGIDNSYKPLLKDMADGYKVIDKLTPKATKELGTSKVGSILKKHPVLTKTLKYGAGIGAAGIAGKEALNVIK